jgi:hypothetical protein
MRCGAIWPCRNDERLDLAERPAVELPERGAAGTAACGRGSWTDPARSNYYPRRPRFDRRDMKQKLIIVDDFYDDPLEVRKRALQLEFPDHGGRAQYAGRNSRLYLLNQQMLNMISRLVGQPLVPARNSPTGHFRISLATDTASQDIHTDPARDWAGILYLNLPEQCRGGTSFFRHKQLGLDEVPMDLAEINRLGFKDREEMRLAIVERDGQDRSKWELTMTVPMRFNRLILFRPWMWHSFTENFGESVETGRLIQVFFFEVAGTRPTAPPPPVGAPIGAADR